MKDKLDQQAYNLQKESQELDEKIQAAKRKEQLLSSLKEKLVKHTKAIKAGSMDLANCLLRECQIEYDRYMRQHSEAAGRRVSKREQDIELKDFTSKWAEFVTDEGNDDD